MKEKLKLAVCAVAPMLLIGGFLWIWILCQNPVEQPEWNMILVAEEEASEPSKIEIITVHENEALFEVTAEDFIQSFNNLFERNFGIRYFPPLKDWRSSSYNSGIHSDFPAMQFVFLEDERIHSLPTFTIYTPIEQRKVQEITVNFDEHSYTDAGYQRYRQLCIYTLKVFLPDLNEDNISQLFDEIISVGNQNVFDSDAWFGSGAVPFALFCQDGVGIYPYFAIGDWQRFCVIPVTDEIIDEFKQKGAEIYEIQ